MSTEKKGFTKREKRLLILMGIVGFTALMVMYVIIPFHNRLQDERARYTTLAWERTQLQQLLAGDQRVRENNVAAMGHFYTARERFLNESHISEIGRMLTNLCLDHDLAVLSQRLSAAEVHEEWTAFKVMSVDKMVSGSYRDIKRLMDTVEQTEYLRITRVSFSILPLGDGEWEHTLDRVSLSLEVIMMRDLEM
ncbi:MAG: type II secretion system protein M [Defluviitaleaceae bacterium]|nr:type II secretion system protein M [Defluviitaleaceae bacterium]MCL2239067.1 type II secretion system protein M [Defluviitaleaceae bacterium]